MTRPAATVVAPLVRFAEFVFGPLAPGIDLVLALFAAGWATLMVERPELFDRGSFVGMTWLPDPAWITFLTLLALLHGIGFFRLHARNLRVASALMSAWIWICVSVSFLRVDVSTGVISYAIIGLSALLGGVYLAGLPRKAG